MNYSIRAFDPNEDTIKPFDCGDHDLNGFLLERGSESPNAEMYEKQRLAKTYVVVDNETKAILAYFSLLNDRIERHFVEPAIWNQLSRKIPNPKRRSSYPALKIGRLAVAKNMQHSGLGAEILTFIQMWFYHNSKTGCRFITVDALCPAIGFYSKCRFAPLVSQSEEDETLLMYFDLNTVDKNK